LTVWLNQHFHALHVSLKRLARNPLATLLSALVIALAAGLPAFGYVLLANIAQLAGRAAPEPQLSLFMDARASDADAQAIEAKLKAHSAVASVRFIARADALKELKASAIGDVVQALEHNPLPHAFVVRATDAKPQALRALRDEIAQWPQIEHTQLDADWAQKLDAMLALGKKLTLGFAVVLGIALVSVIGNTIRLQILNQREEIEVSKLIGATNAFVRRPFLYFGALEGLLGALLAFALVAAGIYALNRGAAELTRLYASDFALRLPDLSHIAGLFGVVAAIGWLGALISVSLYLRDLKG
jgi:cell division transport system permease protein